MARRTGPDGRACASLKRFRLRETYAELKAALAERDLFDEAVSGDEPEDFDCHCTD